MNILERLEQRPEAGMCPDVRTKEVPAAGAEGQRGVWQKLQDKRQRVALCGPQGHCRTLAFILGEVRPWEGLEQDSSTT